MSRLFEDALTVFDTAARAGEPAEFGILVDDYGALRIVPSEGWRPDALQQHHGARMVFQVTRTARCLRVVGQSAGARCTFETASSSPRLYA